MEPGDESAAFVLHGRVCSFCLAIVEDGTDHLCDTVGATKRSSGLYGANGQPLDNLAAQATQVTIANLPSWCSGARYRADDDVITLRIAFPAGDRLIAVDLESTPEQVDALLAALSRLREQARSVASAVSSVSSPR